MHNIRPKLTVWSYSLLILKKTPFINYNYRNPIQYTMPNSYNAP